jgi:hypothetical protein
MTQSNPVEWTNVRSAGYLLAHSVASCSRCGQPTALFALGLLPGHERHLDNEWLPVNASALLFYVEYLPPAVIRVLEELAPDYRPDHSNTTECEYWLNHCQNCGLAQEDYWLHCEPDAAFLPTIGQAAEQIQLFDVRAPFAARAAGFSDEFALIASMRIIG